MYKQSKNDTESKERSHHFSAVINRTVMEGVYFSKHLGNPKSFRQTQFFHRTKESNYFPTEQKPFLIRLRYRRRRKTLSSFFHSLLNLKTEKCHRRKYIYTHWYKKHLHTHI